MSTTTAPTTEQTKPVLSLRGISKTFGAVAALTDVDLDVAAGQVVAIVGRQRRRQVDAGQGARRASTPPDAGTITFEGREVPIPTPARGPATRDRHRLPGPRAVREPQRHREPVPRAGAPPAAAQRRRDGGPLLGAAARSCRRRSRRVRIPVASLSGGQRQTVAIARSLLGDPKLIILDEPTAALGVAQTAEVLNLIERLRESGHGVIMISHNMADVQAVADTVVRPAARPQQRRVRRGRGLHRGDHRRDHRRQRQRRLAAGRPRPARAPSTPTTPRRAELVNSVETPTPQVAQDRDDERLRARRASAAPPRRRSTASAPASSARSPSSSASSSSGRRPPDRSTRSSCPATNLVNLLMECVPTVGIIALGIVCVLLVGADRPLGRLGQRSVGGPDRRPVREQGPAGVAGGPALAILTGAAIGLLYGLIFNRLGVPSFVITLAGLLAFLGHPALAAGQPGRDQPAVRLGPGEVRAARLRPVSRSRTCSSLLARRRPVRHRLAPRARAATGGALGGRRCACSSSAASRCWWSAACRGLLPQPGEGRGDRLDVRLLRRRSC